MSFKHAVETMVGYKQRIKRALSSNEESTPSHGNHSSLGNHLLLLWGRGEISASALQKLAHAAVLDGCQHNELHVFAAFGNFGQHQGNITRDLKTYLEKGTVIMYPLPRSVPTEFRDPKTSIVQAGNISFFMPDDLVAGIFKDSGRFQVLFRTHEVSKFWGTIREDDPKLVILLQEMGWQKTDLQMVVPLFLHGDGVEFNNNDSMMTYHIGSLLNFESSLDAGLLLAACPKSCTTGTTWDPVWESLCQGFARCQAGVDTSGSDIAGGWKFVIWQLLGDHEHFSNQYCLPHWGNHCYCWECKADKTSHTISGFDFGLGSGCKVPQRTVAEELAERLSDHPLFQISGLSHFNIAQDMLHICFVHGVVNKSIGSALKEWCWKDGQGRQKHNPATRLGWIFSRIQALYVERKIPCRLANLHVNMFVKEDSPHKRIPELKCKGVECKWLTKIFHTLAQELHDGTEKAVHIENLFKHMAEFQDLVDLSPLVPSLHQAIQAEHHMKQFLFHYSWLAQNKADGDLSWHIVFKHHMAVHLSQNFRWMNCKFNWCFKSEDFVGRISIMAHSVCFGVKSTALTPKLMEKYRLLMYIKFSRGYAEE